MKKPPKYFLISADRPSAVWERVICASSLENAMKTARQLTGDTPDAGRELSANEIVYRNRKDKLLKEFELQSRMMNHRHEREKAALRNDFDAELKFIAMNLGFKA